MKADFPAWQKKDCDICGFSYYWRELVYQAGRWVCQDADLDSTDVPRRSPPKMPGYGESKYGVDPYGL